MGSTPATAVTLLATSTIPLASVMPMLTLTATATLPSALWVVPASTPPAPLTATGPPRVLASVRPKRKVKLWPSTPTVELPTVDAPSSVTPQLRLPRRRGRPARRPSTPGTESCTSDRPCGDSQLRLPRLLRSVRLASVTPTGHPRVPTAGPHTGDKPYPGSPS